MLTCRQSDSPDHAADDSDMSVSVLVYLSYEPTLVVSRFQSQAYRSVTDDVFLLNLINHDPARLSLECVSDQLLMWLSPLVHPREGGKCTGSHVVDDCDCMPPNCVLRL